MASPESTAQTKTEYRNGDLVSRLLAATPPYLYNMPLVPQSFFFSEMLRSFVQAKAATTNQNTATNIGRRGRKRSWRESKQIGSSMLEKPLELTTASRSTPPPIKPPCSTTPPLQPPPISTAAPPPPPPPPPAQPILLPPLPAQSSDMTSATPLWYPSIYSTPNHLPPQPPPYSFDPLHFFIDLRVSGHIWDRKPEHSKDQIPSPSEPLNLQTEDKKNGLNMDSLFRQRKHVSAFSVPRSKNIGSSNNSCITNNDSSINNHSNSKDRSIVEHKSTMNVSTNYVLQNLSKIYQDVKASTEAEKDEELSPEEKKCKDIRELIGLELVVDYVNHDERPGDKTKVLVDELKHEVDLDGSQEVAVDD